jgi:hypothetical protein
MPGRLGMTMEGAVSAARAGEPAASAAKPVAKIIEQTAKRRGIGPHPMNDAHFRRTGPVSRERNFGIAR